MRTRVAAHHSHWRRPPVGLVDDWRSGERWLALVAEA